MKFREHRGLLDDSMATCIEVIDRAALVWRCQEILGPYGFVVTPEKLHIEPYSYDKRINWDTHIVTLDGYGVIGFTNGPLE